MDWLEKDFVLISHSNLGILTNKLVKGIIRTHMTNSRKPSQFITNSIIIKYLYQRLMSSFYFEHRWVIGSYLFLFIKIGKTGNLNLFIVKMYLQHEFRVIERIFYHYLQLKIFVRPCHFFFVYYFAYKSERIGNYFCRIAKESYTFTIMGGSWFCRNYYNNNRTSLKK